MSTDEKIIKNKVGLLKLAEMLGSVSEACVNRFEACAAFIHVTPCMLAKSPM